ncbi:MAG TPA: TlpA disulfide reductase family protein [Patescibacteria group bacterium]|nr:TlpA disulfide reductase family protein [Patescibacteria group bacterium]
MIPTLAALLIDAPMALYLVWVAFSLALVVICGIWIFRPAVAALPLKRLGVVWLVLTLAVGLVTWRVFSPKHTSASKESVFIKAPNFSFGTVDGQSFSNDSLRGKVVLIDFWASWCGPCREALPDMFRLYKEFKTPRFVMIGVSEDQNQAKFEDFVAKEGMRWPQEWDPQGQLATRFSTNALPSYAVIDAKGRLRFMQRGYNAETYFRIRQAIADALGSGSRLADAGN